MFHALIEPTDKPLLRVIAVPFVWIIKMVNEDVRQLKAMSYPVYLFA